MGLRSGLDNTSIYTMYSLKPSLIYPSFTVYTPGFSRSDYFPGRFLPGPVIPQTKQISPNLGATHSHRGSPGNIGISQAGFQPRLTGSPKLVKGHIYGPVGFSQTSGSP